MGRPEVCGDSAVNGVEGCDDGNLDDANGCSSVCTIEDGFMCLGAHRQDVNTRGQKAVFAMDPATGLRFLNITSEAERCLGSELCSAPTEEWNPDDWQYAYENMTSQQKTLPPRGFYCHGFCKDTFTPPTHYEFDNKCLPSAIDECSRGTSTCSSSAYCIEPADMVGYGCRCFDNLFVSSLDGRGCEESGVELEIFVAGNVNTPSLDEDANRLNMVQARLGIIRRLLSDQYLTAQSSEHIVLQGLEDYDVELVTANIVDGSNTGRSLWRIVVRAPMSHLDVLKLSQSAIADNVAFWNSILQDSDKYNIAVAAQCNNDRRVTCATDIDCLDGGTCDATKPYIKMKVLSGGGSTASLAVESSGADVISVELDAIDSAFKIRIRYDDTIPNVMNTVYLSHVVAPVSNIEMATFRADEFPCLPTGVDALQQRRENSGGCGDTVRDNVVYWKTKRKINDDLQCN